jgi:uncharacterized protein YeeX (DUF496 family)
MTPASIKKRFGVNLAIFVAVIGALYFIYGLAKTFTMDYTSKQKEVIAQNTRDIKKQNEEFQQIKEIIVRNKQISNDYEKRVANKIIKSNEVQADMQKVANRLRETNKFIYNAVVTFVPDEEYINAGKINFIFSGIPVKEDQAKVDEAVATLVFPFIESMKKEFHVYKDTLTVIPNTGIITYLYIKK